MDSGTCSFLVRDERGEEGDNPDLQIFLDLSATVFFVFLFLQSDFEGMLRMMLTKDCSQPVRPYLDSDISTGQRDGGQVKHLKAAKGYQEKSQASREEDEIMRRGRGLYYCLSQDHKQE